MKKTQLNQKDTKTVAEHCSQFSPIALVNSAIGDTPVTCEVCKKWDGKKCSIGMYNVVVKDLRS